MAIESISNSASSVMTVISLVTFLGILAWTFIVKRGTDFDTAARTPFADDVDEGGAGAGAAAGADSPAKRAGHGADGADGALGADGVDRAENRAVGDIRPAHAAPTGSGRHHV